MEGTMVKLQGSRVTVEVVSSCLFLSYTWINIFACGHSIKIFTRYLYHCTLLTTWLFLLEHKLSSKKEEARYHFFVLRDTLEGFS